MMSDVVTTVDDGFEVDTRALRTWVSLSIF